MKGESQLPKKIFRVALLSSCTRAKVDEIVFRLSKTKADREKSPVRQGSKTKFGEVHIEGAVANHTVARKETEWTGWPSWCRFVWPLGHLLWTTVSERPYTSAPRRPTWTEKGVGITNFPTSGTSYYITPSLVPQQHNSTHNISSERLSDQDEVISSKAVSVSFHLVWLE